MKRPDISHNAGLRPYRNSSLSGPITLNGALKELFWPKNYCLELFVSNLIKRKFRGLKIRLSGLL